MEYKPDNRKTTYRVFKEETRVAPKVIFSVTAIKWIDALIEAHNSEVGFYAIVDEHGNDTYYIRDIFYPKHSEMNGATCEISAEGETDVMEWLLEKGREDDIVKMRFWGHVHSGFTTPSGQDETQSYELMNRRQSYLIRAICMKGEISVTFFDYENQIRYDNIKWTVEEGASNGLLIQKLDKIKELVNEDYTEDPHDVLVRVFNIMREDQEREEIEQKIKKLKEENKPKFGHQYHSRSGYGVSQQNLFSGCNSTATHNTNQKVKQVTYNENDDPNDILNEEELISLMTDVDNQITEFNKLDD